ncbi:hypothetical protein [Herbiconiux sp.]|uniref:hypothetical protein n=1 Tax=Herbiconiux sp. TaxID=1871186 RepID=UPI0025C14D69|nr:hypothetical protein [Herbiconiux sp.]
MPLVITVNHDQFILRDPDAISRVRADLEQAVRAGGRLVALSDVPEGPELMITPATHVRIDLLTEAHDERHDGPDFIDFDQYAPAAS